MKTVKRVQLCILLLLMVAPLLRAAGENATAKELYITIEKDGEHIGLSLEKYLIGVLLAEMPADFEMEALKAQAIVARTYAAKNIFDGVKHGPGILCTYPECCQGYLDPVKEYGIQRIEKAVKETAGIVLTYHDKLIEATYFSCSGGYTEDAAAVWGCDYPYLRTVESPGEDHSMQEEIKAFSEGYLEKNLQVSLGEDSSLWFQDWLYTPGHGVSSVKIGDRYFSGTDLRRLLELRSTMFSVEIEKGVVYFHTYGYGHRVGMSQLGAEVQAAAGKTYEEILSWYYCGTELKKISDILPDFVETQ